MTSPSGSVHAKRVVVAVVRPFARFLALVYVITTLAVSLKTCQALTMSLSVLVEAGRVEGTEIWIQTRVFH